MRKDAGEWRARILQHPINRVEECRQRPCPLPALRNQGFRVLVTVDVHTVRRAGISRFFGVAYDHYFFSFHLDLLVDRTHDHGRSGAMVSNAGAACLGMHGFVETEANFLQIFAFAGNGHLHVWIRILKLFADLGCRCIDLTAGIGESVRDFYGQESALDQAEVFADLFAAACAVFFPFVLDQFLAGHDGKHCLHDRFGNGGGRRAGIGVAFIILRP